MARINSLRPRLNRRPFADDIFKCIFLNENEWISPRISLKFVPKGPINNNPALVQIMAWRRSGDKPLSEPLMVSLLTHMCVTRPQWVNGTLNPSVTRGSPHKGIAVQGVDILPVLILITLLDKQSVTGNFMRHETHVTPQSSKMPAPWLTSGPVFSYLI